MLVEDARELVAVPGDVAQAQDGASAGGAPLGLDVAARERPDDDVERVAGAEERIEPQFQGGGGARLEPMPEAQETVGRRRAGRGCP